MSACLVFSLSLALSALVGREWELRNEKWECECGVIGVHSLQLAAARARASDRYLSLRASRLVAPVSLFFSPSLWSCELWAVSERLGCGADNGLTALVFRPKSKKQKAKSQKHRPPSQSNPTFFTPISQFQQIAFPLFCFSRERKTRKDFVLAQPGRH